MMNLIITILPLLVTFTIASLSPAAEEKHFDGEY